MAHQVSSAPLLYTNGAPVGDAPLVWKTLMAHQKQGAPLVLIFFSIFPYILMAHQVDNAPLLVLTSNGAPGRECAITVIFFLFFFCKTTNGAPFHSAPLLV